MSKLLTKLRNGMSSLQLEELDDSMERYDLDHVDLDEHRRMEVAVVCAALIRGKSNH